VDGSFVASVRQKKDYIFRCEGDQEKNTVQALLKTLKESQSEVTREFLSEATHGEIDFDGSEFEFDYRTEVGASEGAGEPRFLIGISNVGRVLPGEPSDRDGRVDARIRAYNSGDSRSEPVATVFVEAKIGANDLHEGQLTRYCSEFNISGRADEWKTLKWADMYSILTGHADNVGESATDTIQDYLLTEFTGWLRNTNQIQHPVGRSRIQDEDGETHIKRLSVGVDEADEPFLLLYGETQAERNNSRSVVITQELWDAFVSSIETEVLRETFGVPGQAEQSPEPDLLALQKWLIENEGYTNADFEGGGTWVRRFKDGDEELKIKLKRGGNLWVRDSGGGQFCPELASGEFKTVFSDIDPSLREAVFINGDIDALWESSR
jgi:hypothetical protein